MGPFLTCMQSYSELQLPVGLVPDLEGLDRLEQPERHPGDLTSVVHPVPYGEAGHHHVSVAYRLDLVKKYHYEAYCIKYE